MLYFILFVVCLTSVIGNPGHARSSDWMTANIAVRVGYRGLLQVTGRRFPDGTEENYENPGSDSRYRRCHIYVMTTAL